MEQLRSSAAIVALAQNATGYLFCASSARCIRPFVPFAEVFLSCTCTWGHEHLETKNSIGYEALAIHILFLLSSSRHMSCIWHVLSSDNITTAASFMCMPKWSQSLNSHVCSGARTWACMYKTSRSNLYFHFRTWLGIFNGMTVAAYGKQCFRFEQRTWIISTTTYDYTRQLLYECSQQGACVASRIRERCEVTL